MMAQAKDYLSFGVVPKQSSARWLILLSLMQFLSENKGANHNPSSKCFLLFNEDKEGIKILKN